MNKNIIAIAVASLGFIIGLWLIRKRHQNRNKSENTISVTGLGTKKKFRPHHLSETSPEIVLN